MDRLIVYPAQVPLDSDLLNTNRSTMIALGKLAGAMFGASNVAVNGLNCTPGTGLAVNVGAGEMYSLQTVDATAYGTLAADTTDQVVKQGIQLGIVSEATPAPATAGQSIVYLIEGQYQDNDAVPVTLPYYNASNPTQAFAGPGNNGAAQATERKGIIAYQVKAGTAATTGTQADPAPDAGWTPLWLVTIANGAVSVVQANIRRAVGPTWISPGGVQPWTAPATGTTLTAGARVIPPNETAAVSYLLPAAPNDGDAIEWRQGPTSFSLNAVTFQRNGNTVMGLAEDMTCNTTLEGGSLVWRATTSTWRVFANSLAGQ